MCHIIERDSIVARFRKKAEVSDKTNLRLSKLICINIRILWHIELLIWDRDGMLNTFTRIKKWSNRIGNSVLKSFIRTPYIHKYEGTHEHHEVHQNAKYNMHTMGSKKFQNQVLERSIYIHHILQLLTHMHRTKIDTKIANHSLSCFFRFFRYNQRENHTFCMHIYSLFFFFYGSMRRSDPIR